MGIFIYSLVYNKLTTNKNCDKTMIKCKVCKKSHPESWFSRHEYTNICRECFDTPEGKKAKVESDTKMVASLKIHYERERKKEEAKKSQFYEGEFDWM